MRQHSMYYAIMNLTSIYLPKIIGNAISAHPIKESQGSRTQIHTIYIRRTITAIMQD